MIRYAINPLVERAVEFGDNVLLPLMPDEAKENLALVYGVLSVQYKQRR